MQFMHTATDQRRTACRAGASLAWLAGVMPSRLLAHLGCVCRLRRSARSSARSCRPPTAAPARPEADTPPATCRRRHRAAARPDRSPRRRSPTTRRRARRATRRPSDIARPEVDPDAPLPEIIYDLDQAARTGEAHARPDRRSRQERRHREAAAADRHRRRRDPAFARRHRRRSDRLPARAVRRQGRPGNPGHPRGGAERRLRASRCRHAERALCLAVFLRHAARQADAARSGSNCSRSSPPATTRT